MSQLIDFDILSISSESDIEENEYEEDSYPEITQVTRPLVIFHINDQIVEEEDEDVQEASFSSSGFFINAI
jgi:hypothetical protein